MVSSSHMRTPVRDGVEPAVRSSPAAPASVELDENGLLMLMHGHVAFQLLWSGAELGLFALLSRRGPLTRERIAAALKLELQPTRILLMGLVSLRVLRKNGDHYANGDVAECHLVPGKPGCAIPWLQFQRHIAYGPLADLTDALRQNRNVGLRHFPGAGDTLYQRIAGHAELERVFHEGMSCLSEAAAVELAAAADLRGSRHLLDLGGGSGTNAIPLAERNAGLKVTIFDFPTVCQAAQRKLEAAALSDRIATLAGNFWTDAFPPDIDCILLAHIVTIWSPEKNAALLRKCLAALPPGGKLLIHSMIPTDDETSPVALGSPYFQTIATGEGMLYCEKDYRQWLDQASFATVSVVRLPMQHALLLAMKSSDAERP